MNYFVGLDVSKGYVDVAIINDAGSIIEGSGCYNDNSKDHAALRQIMDSLPTPPKRIDIAMESTGGLERNWLKMFREYERTVDFECKTYLLNPICIKRFSQLELHKSTTDRSAAKLIAGYIKAGLPRTEFSENERLDDGVRAFYRTILNLAHRKAQIANEIQSMLPSTQTELVQYARDGLCNWLLNVLLHYPTALNLARARESALSKIPYVTKERAKTLIANAKKTVASNTHELAGFALQSLAEEHLYTSKKIEKMQKQLEKMLEKNTLIKKLCTIPGIGTWTAIGLLVEIGDFSRFADGDRLVAYAGLDPVYHQSGDGLRKGRISKKGNRQIRSLLYMPARTAMIHNPIIKDFYQRLRENGKGFGTAIVACMRKLLKISFAILVGEKDFEPDYESKRESAKEKLPDPTLEKAPPKPALGKIQTTESLDAPISRREVSRRKKMTEAKKDLSLNTRSTPQCRTENKSLENSTQELLSCKD